MTLHPSPSLQTRLHCPTRVGFVKRCSAVCFSPRRDSIFFPCWRFDDVLRAFGVYSGRRDKIVCFRVSITVVLNVTPEIVEDAIKKINISNSPFDYEFFPPIITN